MEIDDPHSLLRYVTFNSLQSRVLVATQQGLLVFSLGENVTLLASLKCGPVALACSLDNTSLVYIVGTGESPTADSRVVRLFKFDHDGPVKELTRLSFPTPVINLRVNRTRLVVALEHELHLFEADTLKLLAKLFISITNRGIIDLTVATEQSPQTLVYAQTTASPAGGSHDVVLYDPANLTPLRTVESAHPHPLNCIAFSRDGKFIASASTRGSVIKVFATNQRVPERYSFRRGNMHGAEITCIAFNKTSELLAVSSLTGTVHVFRVKDGLERPGQSAPGYSAMLSNMLLGEEARSFAMIKIPPNVKSIVAFSDDSKSIFVVTQDGKLSQWLLDSGDNGSSYWSFSTSTQVKQTLDKNLLETYLPED